MPEVTWRPPKTKRKQLTEAKCPGCKCRVLFFWDDRVWTAYGNTYARCPDCGDEMFLGRLGLEES